MTTYFQSWVKAYEDFVFEAADPRTKDWLLLNDSPVYVWILTAMYLGFVYVGPKVMKNRTAFSLQGLMFIYNMALVGLSVYMFVEIIVSIIDADYGFLCATYNEERKKDLRELRVAKVLWWYFFSKAIELCDTVLMILRKKMNQVTFLHVFHHATMLNIWWWVMMFIPGGLSYFGSCLNCLVHVVMYSYYGLSVLPQSKGKLWWKRYITRLQLIQFCITLSHTLHSIYMGCDFPRWGQNLLAGYMIFMLVLFTNFYIHAYILSQRKQRSLKDKMEEHANGFTNGSATTNGHTHNRKLK